ncbi:MAG: hypothetical protein V3V01_15095 [Acidimicrobiales bacterium]
MIRIDWRSERGFVGGFEAIPFGILTFVVGALVIVNAWAVIDAKLAVTAASREGVRVFVESDEAKAGGLASSRAAEALNAYGRSDGRENIGAVTASSGFSRCSRVSMEVSYTVPAIALPWIGGFGDSITVRSVHSEIIDPYRDGVPEGGC